MEPLESKLFDGNIDGNSHSHWMPTRQMPLEAASILALRPNAAPYKLSDGGGLSLLVNPNGSKWWRFSYRWLGKRNSLSCGVFPAASLDEARARRDIFQAMLASGIDPREHIRTERTKARAEQVRQLAAARFAIDSDGALSFRLGHRRLMLTPDETAELRAFLDATRSVLMKR